jgi:aminopeptidase N
MTQAAEIVRFFGSIVDDFPYPSLTIAAVEDDLPGGHSPAYLAVVHQPLPTTPFTWRNDPVHFEDFPRFFLAHEVAHQYWGQAVGWKSYHEQWISEGFAQYFAFLYAERFAEPGVARSIVSRLRATAAAQSGQGPIDLGYRLGHVRGDSRVFRSLVYNKAALALHMLRRLIGDEAFFRGVRDFYREWRFMKAGTDEAREAFERASGRPLDRFFQRWFHEFAVPTLRYATRVDGDTLEVVFEQPADAIHDLPVTVTIHYASGGKDAVVVAVTEARTTARVPLKGAVRRVEVNEDDAALARFEKM